MFLEYLSVGGYVGSFLLDIIILYFRFDAYFVCFYRSVDSICASVGISICCLRQRYLHCSLNGGYVFHVSFV